MKKIISILSLFCLILPINTNAWQSVVVSAVVWNINAAPIITNVNPSANPKLVAKNKTQIYYITISDSESDRLYYTITPKYGYVNPISWSISWYSNSTILSFQYLAPSLWYTDEKITVTISDWPNVVIKELNLYIY